jgi:hypothetical protein
MVNVQRAALLALALLGLCAGASGASSKCFRPAAVGGQCAGEEMLCFEADVSTAGSEPKLVLSLLKLVAHVKQLEARIASLSAAAGGGKKVPAKTANQLKALNKERAKTIALVSKTMRQLSWSPATGECRDMDYCKIGTLLATQDGADFLNMQCSREAPGQDDFGCEYGLPPAGESATLPAMRCDEFFPGDA